MLQFSRLIILGTAGVVVAFSCSKLAESPTGPSVVKCEVCHQVPPADSMHRKGSRTDSCSQCHPGIAISGPTIRLDSTHNNGKIDVQCNNAKCHGFPAADTQPFHKARTLANLKCDSCHSGVYIKNGVIEALPNTHGLDSGIFTVNCVSCHAILPGGKPHANSSPTHLNCDSCHTGIIVNAGTLSIREDHTVRPIKCIVCHSIPPNLRVHDTTKKYNCDSCHTGIKIVSNSYLLDSVTHDNGTVNLKCNACHLTPPADKIHDTAKKFNCDSCHTGITIVNNTYSLDTATHDNGTINLKCTACHGFPPTVNPHPKHVTEKKYDCTVCHNGYNGATVPPTPPPYHRTDTVVKFTSTFLFNKPGASFDTATKNCSAVYCHGNFLDGTNRTVNINDKNTIGCGFCHDTTSMFTLGHPRTAPLVWHTHTIPGIIRVCSNCHDGYSFGYDSTNAREPVKVVDSTHLNGLFNVMVLDANGKRITVKPDSTGHVDYTLACKRCH